MSEPETRNRVERDQARLETLIGAVRSRPASSTALADLADHLAGHFGAEESPGGWMAEAMEYAPHHAGLIDDLKSEHGALLAAANGLAAGHGDADLVEEVLKNIERHEKREASVIADIWYEELGTGD